LAAENALDRSAVGQLISQMVAIFADSSSKVDLLGVTFGIGDLPNFDGRQGI